MRYVILLVHLTIAVKSVLAHGASDTIDSNGIAAQCTPSTGRMHPIDIGYVWLCGCMTVLVA